MSLAPRVSSYAWFASLWRSLSAMFRLTSSALPLRKPSFHRTAIIIPDDATRTASADAAIATAILAAVLLSILSISLPSSLSCWVRGARGPDWMKSAGHAGHDSFVPSRLSTPCPGRSGAVQRTAPAPRATSCFPACIRVPTLPECSADPADSLRFFL